MALTTDAFDRHIARPFALRLKLIRARVADAIDELGRNAQLDQYPGRRVPRSHTRMFGAIKGPIVARNDTGTGQEHVGTLATPNAFILPRPPGNMLVGRDGTFVWCRSAVHAYMSLTWTTDPGTLVSSVKPWGMKNGDIWDSVVDNNGGALLMDQFAFVPIALSAPAGAHPALFTFAWRLGLYDKKRDRYLHDGDSLPSSFFSGGAADDKQIALQTRFDEATEIEPRLFVDEFSSILNFTSVQLDGNIQWKIYFTFSMLGFLEQNENRGVNRRYREDLEVRL